MQRAHRLRDPRDFKRVYARGRFARGELLDAKVAMNGRAESRLGVVVSTKVSKSAVRRTRMRRRLYGLLRERWGELAGGYDIVLIARRDFSGVPAPELRAALNDLIAKLALNTPPKNT